jgi:NitT/TauT family transport system substrate-binding protein
MPIPQSRRGFLTDVAFAGAAGLGGASVVGLGSGRNSLAAESPPETTKLRLYEQPATCFAPTWVAGEELLHDEGFTVVQYLTWGKDTQVFSAERLLHSGVTDISLSFLPTALIEIDAGAPLVWLAGSHIGCIVLIGGERVRSTRDLKGKTVPITAFHDPAHTFVSMFAAYVGLDPNKDINWLIDPTFNFFEAGPQRLADGSIDAIMAGPHEAAVFREKKIGHVLVNITTDKPWSQYFCCMIASTKEFVRRYPVATKRAVRAFLKATDLCASDPEGAARLLIERNVPQFYDWQYDKVLQELKNISYGQWREFDPEDAVRFYALRMREVGLIQTSPQKIIDEHTDWRFFNELKHELKV